MVAQLRVRNHGTRHMLGVGEDIARREVFENHTVAVEALLAEDDGAP